LACVVGGVVVVDVDVVDDGEAVVGGGLDAAGDGVDTFDDLVPDDEHADTPAASARAMPATATAVRVVVVRRMGTPSL
jgi:hypothetical protein